MHLKSFIILASTICFYTHASAQDGASEYSNISLGGWLLVNHSGNSDGSHNGIYFGTRYAGQTGELIASNRKDGGYGPKYGLNFWTARQLRLVIGRDGNVGIGTPKPTKLLSVNGTVLAKNVEISTQSHDWPDYVFKADYKLKSLTELKEHINTYKHLPYFPSEKSINESQLYNLNNTTINLLRTVEELTLHIIALNERLEKLESNKCN